MKGLILVDYAVRRQCCRKKRRYDKTGEKRIYAVCMYKCACVALEFEESFRPGELGSYPLHCLIIEVPFRAISRTFPRKRVSC